MLFALSHHRIFHGAPSGRRAPTECVRESEIDELVRRDKKGRSPAAARNLFVGRQTCLLARASHSWTSDARPHALRGDVRRIRTRHAHSLDAVRHPPSDLRSTRRQRRRRAGRYRARGGIATAQRSRAAEAYWRLHTVGQHIGAKHALVRRVSRHGAPAPQRQRSTHTDTLFLQPIVKRIPSTHSSANRSSADVSTTVDSATKRSSSVVVPSCTPHATCGQSRASGDEGREGVKRELASPWQS